MSDLYWLTDEQMERLRPHFPKSHGRPRVDDRRVLSGIIFVNRNGLRWRDAPAAYGPHKTDPPSVWWTPMLAFRSWRGVSDECSTPELSGFFQARGR